eukprot:12337481-Karenia_brevis.AAC.1
MSWCWDSQVAAVQNPSIQCWVCGQMGHIGRNCLSKGLGKGSPPLGKGGPQVGVKGKGNGAGAPPFAGNAIPAKGTPGNKGGGCLSMKVKGMPGGIKGYGKGVPFQGFCSKCGIQGHR